MTVASEINRSGPYIGNGVTTVFDYEFRILDQAHVKVIRAQAGIETELTLGVDYAVSGVGASGGGSITTTVAPSATETITLLLKVPFTQETDLENQGPYYAETVEAALDLATMRDQQLAELVSRTVRVPASNPGYDPDQLVNDVLDVKSNREITEAARDDAVAAAAALENQARQYDTLAQAAAAQVPAPVTAVRINGYAEAGDGGDALYRRVGVQPAHPGKFQSADGAWWEIVPRSGFLGFRPFGAKGNKVANDTTPVANAVATAFAMGVPNSVEPGYFLIDNLVLPYASEYGAAMPFDAHYPKLIGCPGAFIVKRNGGDSTYLCASERWVNNTPYAGSPVWVENITFDGNGIARDAFVNTGYSSTVKNCRFTGAIRYGCDEPVTTRNGSAILSPRFGSRYHDNWFYNNGVSGFHVADNAGGPAFITDAEFLNNRVWDNKYNLYIEQSAGWSIRGNHVWNYSVAPSGNALTYIAGVGVSTIISENIFEGYDGQCFGLTMSVVAYSSGTAVNNKYLNGYGVNAIGGATGVCIIANSEFNGAQSCVTHGVNSEAYELISRGNHFECLTPYKPGNASYHIRSEGDRIGVDQFIYSGRQRGNAYCVEASRDVVLQGSGSQTFFGASPGTNIWDAPLTSSFAITLPLTTDSPTKRGLRYRFVRGLNATGAFTITIQAAGPYTVGALAAPGQWVDVEASVNGWHAVARGTL
jgi:hypothetical protein